MIAECHKKWSLVNGGSTQHTRTLTTNSTDIFKNKQVVVVMANSSEIKVAY